MYNNYITRCGGLAQLVEHLLCTQGVRSSNLLSSTNKKRRPSFEGLLFLDIIVIYWVVWLLQMVRLFRAVHFEILFRKSAEKLGKNFFKIPVTWKFLIDSKKTQRSELVFQFFWLRCNVSVPWRILTRLSKANAVPVKNLTEWSFYERKNVMECKDFRQ